MYSRCPSIPEYLESIECRKISYDDSIGFTQDTY